MQPHELKPLTDALLATFDAIGARPPGQAGIEVWFRTLRPFALGDAVGALDAWAVRNRRAPAPADIAETCREAAADRTEKQRAQWKADEREAPKMMQRTEGGRRALRELKGIVGGMQRSQLGLQRDWAHRTIDRFIDHDVTLAPVAFDTACVALGKTPEERRELIALREANIAGAMRAAAELQAIARAEDARQAAIEAWRSERRPDRRSAA